MTARRSFPATTTALLVLALAVPLGLPGQAELQQSAALCCVFFWSLFRPASMPPAAVSLIGLLSDLLSFAPIGTGVLTLLVAHGLAMRWRGLVRRGFVTVWLAFVSVAVGAAALGWAFTSLLMFRLLPPLPGLLQAGLSAGLYPAVALLLTSWHQTLAEPGRA